jgi:hypothetical protein
MAVTQTGGLSVRTIRILDSQVDHTPAIAGPIHLHNSTILVRGGDGIKSPGIVDVVNSTISGTSRDGAPGVEAPGPGTLAHATLEGGPRTVPIAGPVFVGRSILAGPCDGPVAPLGTSVLDRHAARGRATR